MEQTPKHLKAFLQEHQERIREYANQWAKHPEFSSQQDKVTELYEAVKQIRDRSSWLGLKSIFHNADHLLTHFDIEFATYRITTSKPTMVALSLRTLLAQINAALNHIEQPNSDTIVSMAESRSSIIVVQEPGNIKQQELLMSCLEHEDLAIIELPYHTVIETLISKDIKLVMFPLTQNTECKLVNVVNSIRKQAFMRALPIIAYTTESEAKQLKHDFSIYIKQGVDHVLSLDQMYKEYLLAAIYRHIEHFRFDSTMMPVARQRKEMEKLIQNEWFRFIRFQSYFSLIQVKLDAYSSLIQQYGAEQIISYVDRLYAAACKVLRFYDEGRLWNSHSFMVLLPASKLEGAVIVGERIKAAAMGLHADSDLSPYIQVAAIESHYEYEHAEDMYGKLDAALMLEASPKVIAIHPTKPEPDERAERTRILILDDDPMIYTLLDNHLDPEVYDVKPCLHGHEAYDQAMAFRPHVIISETSMLDLDGYLFCQQTRGIKELEQAVFMFLSKHTMTRSITRAFQVGADEYMTKPFSVQELEARITRWLKIRR